MPPRLPGAIAWLLLAPASTAQDARALFLAHCASCHGESGDGRGTTTLDRPARSFQDGGFSYGNTPEAIVRTITFGIPGTPMPAAPSILTDAERRALADHVISLGPPGVVVKPGESVLVVRDRPVIARGKLPPIAAGLPERPRGLLLGTTDGLSFEYRIDDVRLLGVRQGAFADRRDWIGRGGDSLEPLGKIVWLAGQGDPGPTFRSGEPLQSRLAATWVDGSRCGLTYHAGGMRVDESVCGSASTIGAGFERSFCLRGAGSLTLRAAEPGPAWIASGTSWCTRRRADGVVEAVSASGLRGSEVLALAGGGLSVRLDLARAVERRVTIRTVLAPKWDEGVLAQWLAEGPSMIALALALLGDPRASSGDPAESDFYRVDCLKAPEGAVLEVGGMGFLPDGRLVASTRRGQVWIVENPLAEKPEDARFQLFAEGLQEGLGLAVVDGAIHVLQRGEISRLSDVDGDGACDRVETVATGWGVSGHYHEFAFGLPRDALGNFYVSLNVSFGDPHWWHGRSTVPWRGWILKVSPQGELAPFASGFRSPCGLGMNAEGDLFETDNQGDWMPACPIFHVKPGRFYGHPASLSWTDEYRAANTTASDTIPPDRARENAAVWLPYKWSRSAGNLVEDATGGRFGPFAGQMFVAEITNGMVLRVQMEKVRGEWQGACFLFRQRVGSAARVLFAPDGTLLAGFTNRGWGGLAPAQGIARVRWTGRTPFEMKGVHLLQDGFDVEFTKPLGEAAMLPAADVRLHHYDWWWEYGSPERGSEKLEVRAMTVSADRTRLRIHLPGLRAGEIARVVLRDVRSEDGEPLLHDEFDYTINELPEGPPSELRVARLVPPPPARESGNEGWLRLCHGDALDLWIAKGWKLCDAELDPEDARKLATKEGVGALVNDGSGDFTSEPIFGDVKVHAEFMLPEGGGGALCLMGRYELRLSADESCGSLAPSVKFPGRPPALEAFKGPGQQHDLDLVFRAPRFDASGTKVESARFEKVMIDDILLHDSVDVPEPSEGGFAGEVAEGPLRFRGDRGTMALGGIRVFPIAAASPDDEKGWVPLFDGEQLLDWKTSGAGTWTVDDGVIRSGGKQGHLFSPRDDYRDFEVRARMKIGEGGNSGLYFRTKYGEGWPSGYEAQVNSSHPDPQRTGGLYGLAPVKVALVGPDTWFDYRVRCVDEAEGTRIRIRVNGALITDFLDRERRHDSGHIALQQHHEGSVLEVRSIEVREVGR